MGVFICDKDQIECIYNLSKKGDGFFLPCVNCKNIKPCIIFVDHFNKKDFRMSIPDIKCVICGTILTKDKCVNDIEYKNIYNKICNEIEDRFVNILEIFNENCKIINNSNDKMNITYNMLKVLLYNYINMYGIKKKMIDIIYLLKKIIDLEVEESESKQYDKIFYDLMEYSFDTICELLDASL